MRPTFFFLFSNKVLSKIVTRISWFTPLPFKIGDGQEIDLLEPYILSEKKEWLKWCIRGV